MSFTYTTSIPATNNNPSDDQPDMQTNTNSINSLIAVDHVSFNNSAGGKHLQVTFNSENTPSSPTDPESVLFTGTGVAQSEADLKFINANATFLLNSVRACAIANTGGIISTQSFNVTSVTNTATGRYAVVLPADVVTGTGYGVLVTASRPLASSDIYFSYEITSATAFTINFRRGTSATLTDPTAFTFQVIQM